VLACERLDRKDATLGHMRAAPRKDPTSQLSIELDQQTVSVLITVTHVGADVPDLDPPLAAHGVALTIDHAL
jgi:hypothetical protein